MKLENLQEKVSIFATKIQTNVTIQVISKSMTKLMPVLMIGAVCSLITGLPLGDWYTNFLTNTGLSTLFSDVNTIAQLVAVWSALSIGLSLIHI